MKSGRESLGRHGDTSFHPPGPTPPSRPTLATSVLFSFFLSFFLPLLSIESFNAVSLCAKRGDREGRGEARAEQREERGATDPANVAISSFLFSFLPPCHFFPSLPYFTLKARYDIGEPGLLERGEGRIRHDAISYSFLEQACVFFPPIPIIPSPSSPSSGFLYERAVLSGSE